MIPARRPSSTARPARSAGAFTLLELLVVLAVIAVLAALVFSVFKSSLRMAQRTQCMNNLKQFMVADLAYFTDNGEFPAMNDTVPSSMTLAHLEIIAKYTHLPIPPGPLASWPKRPKQPPWINCPRAQNSGYAEGRTVGSGIYTGYIYVAGIEQSKMVARGLAKLTNPEHSAHKRNVRRGVMWADILAEFRGAGDRRFECFHVEAGVKYPDFRFHQKEIEGIHRAWSDGSIEWVPINSLDLSGDQSPDAQIQHILGNYYY